MHPPASCIPSSYFVNFILLPKPRTPGKDPDGASSKGLGSTVIGCAVLSIMYEQG